jgi:hypothetical protein
MPYTFTTVRNPVERLLEAEYFLAHLPRLSGIEYQFELNTFLSASRNVTFQLQKAMAHVPGFPEWYGRQQQEMKADAAMRFFVELRNVSQKQGPVSYIGSYLGNGAWTHHFVGSPDPVPAELTGKDITVGCAVHLVKLANVLAGCVQEFPFHTCPARALTEQGMANLGYDWADAEIAAGFPPGWTDVEGVPAGERLHMLSLDIEPLNTASIERIARGDLREGETRNTDPVPTVEPGVLGYTRRSVFCTTPATIVVRRHIPPWKMLSASSYAHSTRERTPYVWCRSGLFPDSTPPIVSAGSFACDGVRSSSDYLSSMEGSIDAGQCQEAHRPHRHHMVGRDRTAARSAHRQAPPETGLWPHQA